MSDKITVKTTPYSDGRIEITTDYADRVGAIQGQIIDTKEDHIRKALAVLGWVAPEDAAKLRAQLADRDARLAVMSSAPLRGMGGEDEGFVKCLICHNEREIGEQFNHRDDCPFTTLPERAKAMLAVVEAAQKGAEAVRALINCSRGVEGLHLNGDVAVWDELESGGRYEDWLQAFNDLEATLAAYKGDRDVLKQLETK